VITYFLDGKPCPPLNLSLQQEGSVEFHNIVTGTLNNLSDGYHTLEIKVKYLAFGNGSASTIFLVNSTGYQTPQILSPLNTTYTENKVPLTYTSDENKYSVYYKVDNSDYITITSNTTLSAVSEGQHVIFIKAMNGDSLYSEQPTYFSVNTTKSNLPAVLPISSILAIIVLIAMVAVASVSLVYFRRRKGKLASKLS
jgi:hypothetical protein